MRGTRLAILFGLLGAVSLAPSVAAVDPLVVSGRLTPASENPAADPDGRGAAVLTINEARTQLTYTITYRNVAVPITTVNFCAGQNPREVPIPITCAFAIPAVAGGASPITGSQVIVASQADVLASGYAVIQLGSASGPQLAGYVQVGPLPPDTATIPRSTFQQSPINVGLPVLGGVVAFVLVAGSNSRRRRPVD
jgi:hypothetical protein